MIVPDSEFRAHVGGVDFTGEPFLHVPGVYVTGVEGLLDGGDPSSESVAQDTGDGVYDLPNQRNSERRIALKGFVYARTLADLGQMNLDLRGILAEKDDRSELQWREFGEWWWTWVRRAPGFQFVRRGSTGFADYTIRLRAPSQIIYGEPEVLRGVTSVNAASAGTVEAWPEIDVPGPHSGFTINGPGGLKYTTTQAAAAGKTHTVEMRTGRLYLDGVQQFDVVTSADVWPVTPDLPGTPMSITGAPRMNITVPRAII